MFRIIVFLWLVACILLPPVCPDSSAQETAAHEAPCCDLPVPLENAGACYERFKKKAEGTVGEFNLDLALTGYYDWWDSTKVGGGRYRSVDGTGGMVQFMFDWSPMESGTFDGEFRYGQGMGAMADPPPTLGAVNQLSGDDTKNHIQVFVLEYTQEFLDGDLFVTLGKNEPEAFIDENDYANDEFTQFVDQALVNDPVLDEEDEQMPMVAIGGNPMERLSIQGVALATTHTQSGKGKKEFDDPLATPFFGIQAAYDATILGRNGTYRLTGFTATYSHYKLNGGGNTSPGCVLGVNFNQQLTDKLGVFGRAYWHDPEVYQTGWTFSGGLSGTGLIPGRDDDVLGLGAAVLLATDVDNADPAEVPSRGGAETHLEAYYRFNLWDHVFLTPDVRYVIAPMGDESNNNIFTTMLRLQLAF